MTQTTMNNSTSTENKPTKPYRLITFATAKKVGAELNQFLEQNNLVYDIAGKKYVPVEGWQFVGMQVGLVQIITECSAVAPFEDSKELKYQAVVEIINQYGTVVSRGFAWASNKEKKKTNFEEYAIASMAQTRAIGKAYRNILSWIVKMAGYEATPVEEIDRDAMEDALKKKKQEVLKALNFAGIIAGNSIMDHIEKTLGKRVIENMEDADKLIDSVKEQEEIA